ncbi:hypothetical protein [Lacticaseibacillus suilingensis]|uniref:hypothetical protein n=1 Tax=Lacticaseibacillus suilingensis TaxID=2799577 RepID=UPI0022DF7173|nr:hypothetical protein [Lacticaseibacillus suilingensis]
MVMSNGIELRGFEKILSQTIDAKQQQAAIENAANAVFSDESVKGAIKELAQE